MSSNGRYFLSDCRTELRGKVSSLDREWLLCTDAREHGPSDE